MRKIICIICSFFLFFLSSCDIKLEKYGIYLNEEKYEILSDNGIEVNESIEEIELDWVKGNIKIIESNNYENIFITETIKGNIKEDYKTRFLVLGSTLSIKYCKSNTSIASNIRKSITIYVNPKITLTDFEIKNVSSSVEINEINSDELDIDNVSGSVKINKIDVNKIEYNGVSGSLTCVLNQLTNEVSINQVSGSSIVSIPSSTGGFKVDYESVSGTVNYDDFKEAIKYENEIIYLDRTYLNIDVESVSGTLYISKYNSEESIIKRNTNN